jgi:hypothetical protein
LAPRDGFIDGLFPGTPVAIPLGPVDHSFHLLLGLAAFAVLVVNSRPSYHNEPTTT